MQHSEPSSYGQNGTRVKCGFLKGRSISGNTLNQCLTNLLHWACWAKTEREQAAEPPLQVLIVMTSSPGCFDGRESCGHPCPDTKDTSWSFDIFSLYFPLFLFPSSPSSPSFPPVSLHLSLPLSPPFLLYFVTFQTSYWTNWCELWSHPLQYLTTQ